MRPDGITSFSMIQLASDAGNAAGLVFFLFDLLYLDGEDLTAQPLIARKQRLADLLPQAESPVHYSDHQIGLGPAFYEKACPLEVEGASRGAPIISSASEPAQALKQRIYRDRLPRWDPQNSGYPGSAGYHRVLTARATSGLK